MKVIRKIGLKIIRLEKFLEFANKTSKYSIKG